MQLIKEQEALGVTKGNLSKCVSNKSRGVICFSAGTCIKCFCKATRNLCLSFLGRGPDSVLRGRGGALGTSQTCSSVFCFVLAFVLQAFLVTEPRTGVTGSRGQALGFTILSHMGPGGHIGP